MNHGTYRMALITPVRCAPAESNHSWEMLMRTVDVHGKLSASDCRGGRHATKAQASR